jgi:hypothetical protein
MATTTNYGWDTPDDTDLVKDGAAAIRTLGSSVDTTTKALNPSTTLGDIEFRSSTANTNTRLGIGSTGQVLTVAGGVPTWDASNGYTLLTSGSLPTGANNLALTGITGTYRDLVLVIKDVSFQTNAQRLSMRVNNTSSIYESASASQATTALTDTQSDLTLQSIWQDSNDAFFVVTFFDYANTTSFKYVESLFLHQVNSTPGWTFGQVRIGIRTTSAINEINLESNAVSPDNFFGGAYQLYGRK